MNSKFTAALLLLCVLSTLFDLTKACHSAEDGDDEDLYNRRRKKRQAGRNENPEIRETRNLREFFSICMRESVGNLWEWESVLDFTILDSQWYRNSDASNCSASTSNDARDISNKDSAECWKARLDQLLKQRSSLLGPSRICIDQYTNSVGGNFFRKKRQARRLENERCTNFSPNSPDVVAYTGCGAREIVQQPGRGELNFPSVTQFIAEDTICAIEFPGCGTNGEQALSGDADVPNFPYQLEALTRQSSPVFEAVTTCNDLIFPLSEAPQPTRATETDCEPWNVWSFCSVRCGSGSRVRSRTCPAGSAANTIGREVCRRPPCIQRNNNLLQLITSIRLFRGDSFGSSHSGSLFSGGAPNPQR